MSQQTKKTQTEQTQTEQTQTESKTQKRHPIAKSLIVFDIKPYDISTDLDEMAGKIKKIKLEGDQWIEKKTKCNDDRCTLEAGCRWGEGHKLVPIGFGIHKLQIQCVVQDELVGSEDLIDMMMEIFEEEIQSVDIAAFNKI